MAEKLGFCFAMCYLCKRNHKVDSVRLHIKEEAAVFSFIFYIGYRSPVNRVVNGSFLGVLVSFLGMKRSISRYVTMHFILCYDANAIVLQRNRCFVEK